MLAAMLLTGFAVTSRAADMPTPDDGKQHKLALHDGNFYIDDNQVRLISGEMHPGRIPPELWESRIKQARAMGLNAISVYLFWNQIEPTEGNFVWTGNTDIHHFIDLCQKNGMWVVVRAGPYICGEWEFGGFPGWLCKYDGMILRSNDAKFLELSNKYVENLGKQIASQQVTHGGPVLMVQFENEYHKIDAYLKNVQDMFVKAGFDTQLMTCDPGAPNATPWNIDTGLPGVLRAYNGFNSTTQTRYDRLQEINKPTGFPDFSPEVYTGWFNTWGPVARVPKVAVNRQVADVDFFLAHPNLSWSYYVYDGGTNFGFWSGANNGTPMQTSYDYDAPIDEMGRATPKYKALRAELIAKLGIHPPEIPADPKVIEIPTFTLNVEAPLLSRLPAKAIESENAVPMEKLDQYYGFIDYQRQFPDGLHGSLSVTAHDYAWIMVNGKVVYETMMRPTGQPVRFNVDQAGPVTLDILVHNLGRDSLLGPPYPADRMRKGMIANPTLGALLAISPPDSFSNGQGFGRGARGGPTTRGAAARGPDTAAPSGITIAGWKIYNMPLDNPDDLPAATVAAGTPITGPAFFSGSFNVSKVGETYLDMSAWHMGVVWVNGHNLGRFWEVGDNRALYLPSVWMKPGANKIEVLELGKPPEKAEVKGVGNAVFTTATPIKPLWN